MLPTPDPSTTPAAPGPWRRLARRVLPLAALALAVLAVHGLLLAGWPASRPAAASPAPRALSVRHIVAPVAQPTGMPPAEAPPAARTVPAKPAAMAVRRPLPSPVAPPAAPPPGPQVLAAQVAADAPAPEVVDAPPSLPALVPAALTLAAMASPGAAEPPPPTYRTRVPPSTQLQYELRRGALTGEGELRWQRSADGYEMSMEGSVFGFQVLSQASRGGFDLAGVAPLRFVDRRRGRDLRAANFQRDRGLITYSGSSAQYPLPAGAQDRLSWMVQLAAIVEAEPARFRPGEQVEMAVSGSRGDTDVWTFTVSGREAVDIAGARLERSLALRREPRKPYDTRVEVWLDPARHHLPARIRLSSERGAEALDFVLKP